MASFSDLIKPLQSVLLKVGDIYVPSSLQHLCSGERQPSPSTSPHSLGGWPRPAWLEKLRDEVKAVAVWVEDAHSSKDVWCRGGGAGLELLVHSHILA